MTQYATIDSISDVHRFYRCEKPKHPLISVIDLTRVEPDRTEQDIMYRTGFYTIMYKCFEGAMKYGRSYYDFQEGALMFTAPGQVVASSTDTRITEGWGLFFHPDLLAGKELGKKIQGYSFFLYDANEALHISDEEKSLLLDCLEKIRREYSQNIDKHTRGLIVDNVQIILDYCNRFYDRQFFTREKAGHDVVQKFEALLIAYFTSGNLIENGIPGVKYFASKLNLSANYLSDLLNKFTGKTTQEHIYLQLIAEAKKMLWESEKSISEIAYGLGFEHPSHFTKLFKGKTGLSPKEYRNSD